MYRSSTLQKLVRVEFEVFGKVQGVNFRKYIQAKSRELGIRGWCKNTGNNTVKGVIEGEFEEVQIMKKWLQEVGSPNSEISKVVFSNEKLIDHYSYKSFVRQKTS